MPSSNHFDSEGNVRMVDVGQKETTRRIAVAAGEVRMKAETAKMILAGSAAKGDVLGIARVAGIMGAKSTANLIPLCHPIAIDSVAVDFEIDDTDDQQSKVLIQTTVSSTGRTGVEMEALTAAAAAGLTIYDMCKSVDRDMVTSEIRLLSKSGGSSGEFARGTKTEPERNH